MAIAKLLLTWHLLGCLFATLACATPMAKNTREFKSLCRLLKIAEEGAIKLKPDEKAKKAVRLDEVEKIAEDFTALERKLSEASTFPLNFTESVNGENYSISAETKLELMRRIMVSKPVVEQLRKKMEAKKDEVKEEYETAKEKFKEAIVGTSGDKLEDGEYKTKLTSIKTSSRAAPQRAAACSAKGGQDDGAQAGNNLRFDLLCVCAPGEGTHTIRVCGFGVGTSYTWSANTESNFQNIWTSIYDNCEASNSSNTLDPDNIESALAQFESLLGAGASEISNHRVETNYVLGFMTAAHGVGHTCTGTSLTEDSNGVCINNSTQQSKEATTKALNVTWRLKLISAKEAIENARDKAYAAQPILRRLENLHHNVINAAITPTSASATYLNSETPSPSGKPIQKGTQPTEVTATGQANTDDAGPRILNLFLLLAGSMI